MEPKHVSDVTRLLDQPTVHLSYVVVAKQPGAGGQCDSYTRLGRLDLQVDGFIVDLAKTITLMTSSRTRNRSPPAGLVLISTSTAACKCLLDGGLVRSGPSQPSVG
jgi:hypothetical protein